MKRLSLFLFGFVLALNLLVPSTKLQAQLRFNYESTGNALADGAIERATKTWASTFQDEITINLNFNFTVLGAGHYAGASVNREVHSYSSFWNAVGEDMSSQTDASLFNALPTGSSFSLYINRTKEAGGMDHSSAYVDDNGGRNNSFVNLSTANAKALGLRDSDDASLDATISFNRSYNWDYNPQDGVDGSALDFEGIATHEIGHALGFLSGVDNLADGTSSPDGESRRYAPDDSYVFVTALDFLRHSQGSMLAGADMDWTADMRDKYFSTDGVGGGSDWSTTVLYGDGEQASHWKKGMDLGIMDPNASEGRGLRTFRLGHQSNGRNRIRSWNGGSLHPRTIKPSIWFVATHPSFAKTTPKLDHVLNPSITIRVVLLI